MVPYLYSCIVCWDVCCSGGFQFFVEAFYHLGYITCTTVADLYIVSIENFSERTMRGSVGLLDLENPYRCLTLRFCCMVV